MVLKRAAMLCERQEHAMCTIDNRVVASGGESFTGLNTAEIYDIARDSWNMLPKLNVGRSCHSSCSVSR